jgi:hypothetical protein
MLYLFRKIIRVFVGLQGSSHRNSYLDYAMILKAKARIIRVGFSDALIELSQYNK